MSIEATTWAINAKVGDATAKLVLWGLANHAHKDGTGAWASIGTLAEYAECSDRTVQRKIRDLEEAGLISRGDQRIVDHIQGNRRPIVWDLQISGVTFCQAKNPRGDSRGDKNDVRGDKNTTSGVTELCPTNRTRTISPTEKPLNTSTLHAEDDDATPDRPEVNELCNHLADAIEANGSRRPTVTRKWHDACRLMLDRDGRTTDQVRAAIDWCQADEFWRSNILSMPKLREKYDQMSLQARRQPSKRLNGAQQSMANLKAMLDREHMTIEDVRNSTDAPPTIAELIAIFEPKPDDGPRVLGGRP